MKLKVKYSVILFILLMQISCNKWLESLPPNGLIREEFWKSKEDVEAVLMAAYELFASMDRTLFLQGELRGDLLFGGSNQPSRERSIAENNIYPDNNYCDWTPYYKIINHCNEVIKNAPLVQEIDNTFTDFRKQSLMAEAYFIRGLAYFYLVRIYNEVPLVLEPSETDNSDFYIPKSTESEVLNKVVIDLKQYREFAPSGGFSTIIENKGRASKPAFDALLADIALWRFEYDKVLEHVEKIENSGEIELMKGGEWFQIFNPGNSIEGIFEFQFDGNLNQRNGTFGLTQRFSNQYFPSQKAIEMFGKENANELVRGENASIAKIGEDDFIIWKYVGQFPDGQSFRSGNDQYSCNWIVYRYADVLLMKAEALSQTGRYAEALAILNKIRERANLQPKNIVFNAAAFEDAIMEERALEFAYEGKRWFDLLRLGRRNNFSRKNKLIEVIISNVPSNQKRILAVKLTNPLGWYLPIYESEIERNKNLNQNQYYEF